MRPILSLLAHFVCLSASAADVTISGRVTDAAGKGVYATVTIYRSSDKVVVERFNTTLSGANVGAYSAKVPAGTYDFYVRGFGYAPQEKLGVAAPADVTVDFPGAVPNLPALVPAYLKSAAVSLPSVALDGTSAITYTLTANADLGKTITVFNEFAGFRVDGAITGTIDLYDDGTHGDAVAGDRVYTRSGISGAASPDFRCSTMNTLSLLYARVPSQSPSYAKLPDTPVIGVAPAAPPINVVTAKAQYTQYAANIVADTTLSGWEKGATKEFYKTFADIYDFVVLFPMRALGGAAGYSYLVRNDVTGIGEPIVDDSAQYGSAGVLQSVNVMTLTADPPLLHETMHRWGARLVPPFDEIGFHWGYSSVNGVLGGFDGTKLVKNSDGSYTAPGLAPLGYQSDGPAYAPLERYVAGFIAASAVPPITVFTNVTVIDAGAERFSGTRTDITIADITGRYGPRNPDVTRSQKAFRAAFVGVTPTLLNPAGMSYLNILARQFGGVDQCQQKSFPAASGGVATMDTTIATHHGPRRRTTRH